MIRRQGYRFRLKPTQADVALLRRFVGCSRFVWNECLALNELRHERGERRLGYNKMAAYLRYLKNEYPFLGEVHSQPLQQTLRDLSTAYKRAFDPTLNARMPRFKKRHRAQGIRFPQGFQIDGQGVFLPKIGWIGFRKSCEILGTPRHVTISYSTGHWYLTILTQREVVEPVHPSTSVVGIDLGVKRFAALSDGTFIEGANAFKKHQARLAVLQRRLARKSKFSQNWKKAKHRITRLQGTIANIRNDMLHKASTTISKNHATVVLEDLRISNMTASAKGTIEQPGTNVRAKSGLNRRILDQGWGEFRRQLGYKLAWLGGALILVDARNTSRTCSACGHVARENRQTQATFACVACCHASNADTNAAINILSRGMTRDQGTDSDGGFHRRETAAQIARGDSPVGGSSKQEAQRVA